MWLLSKMDVRNRFWHTHLEKQVPVLACLFGMIPWAGAEMEWAVVAGSGIAGPGEQVPVSTSTPKP